MPTPTLTDQAFLDTTADRLAALPAVRAVTLGGSRAQGVHGPDSDWDLAVYYRGASTPRTCAPSAGRERSRSSAPGAAASSTGAPG